MRTRSKFAALALSVALALGVVAPAFAADAPIPTVDKKLQVNNGSSVTATFSYTATAKALTVGSTTETTYTDGPAVAIANIALTATNAEATGTGAITFGGQANASAFPHAGTYAWVVKETTNTYSGIGAMQYDPQVYTLIATVVNGTSGLEFGSFIIVKGEASSTANDPDNKAGSLAFTNKYTETTSDQDPLTDLTITKAVTGAQADRTKEFEFTVTFDASALTVLPAGKTATQVLDDITVDATGGATNVVAAAASGNTRVITFKAADTKSIKFTKVLAGITYTIAETDVTGYTESYAAVANGVSSTSTSGLLIGENTNTGTMTNAYQDITPTGLILNNAPFILLGAVAVAGVVFYGAAKRKLVA